jgi:hypothetical protein
MPSDIRLYSSRVSGGDSEKSITHGLEAAGFLVAARLSTLCTGVVSVRAATESALATRAVESGVRAGTLTLSGRATLTLSRLP